MNAWLVINSNFNHKHKAKFEDIYNRLILSAKNAGITLIKKENHALIGADISKWIEAEKPKFVLFWDKDTRLAKLLELYGLRLFNSARAIEVCDDKTLMHIELMRNGVKTPKTLISPLNFFQLNEEQWKASPFVANAITQLRFPMVLKENFSSFGEQVYLLNDEAQLLSKIASLNTPFILQEFIKTSYGKDIRINMVGDVAVAAMCRYNDNDFRANVTSGGNMKPHQPSDEEVAIARAAVRALGLDFGGVDLLFDEDGPILCEVNSNAHFKNIYDCTGIDVAKPTFDYILKEINA